MALLILLVGAVFKSLQSSDPDKILAMVKAVCVFKGASTVTGTVHFEQVGEGPVNLTGELCVCSRVPALSLGLFTSSKWEKALLILLVSCVCVQGCQHCHWDCSLRASGRRPC